ncbi:MAG: carotenoid biosynthesis protein [Thermomicrobiales bacterium]
MRASSVRRAILRIAFVIFAIGWLLAVIGISRDMRLPIDERWAASALLILEGGIAVLWVAEVYAWRRAIAFAFVVLPLAFTVELIGVTTGFPFGHYHYTGALIPLVVGRVPAPITCAWLMIVLGSLVAARVYMPHARSGVTVIIAAALATGLDACLEPTAFHIKAYWLWAETGPYYGVPTRNFVGWFVAAVIIIACAAHILWRDGNPRPTRAMAIPLALYWSTVVMFAVIDFFRGYPGGAAIGGVFCLTALPALARSLRRVQGHQPDMYAPSIPDSPAATSAPNSRE